jgi:hypothetical protein
VKKKRLAASASASTSSSPDAAPRGLTIGFLPQIHFTSSVPYLGAWRASRKREGGAEQGRGDEGRRCGRRRQHLAGVLGGGRTDTLAWTTCSPTSRRTALASVFAAEAAAAGDMSLRLCLLRLLRFASLNHVLHGYGEHSSTGSLEVRS